MIDTTKLQEELRAFAPSWVTTESWDVQSALSALDVIISLVRNEANQNEEGHVKDLIAIFNSICQFIGEELDQAMSASAPEEYNEAEDGTLMRAAGEGEGSNGGFLVKDDKGGHLPVKKGGKLSHRLMGAAWAALHGGFRGNKYSGSGKEAAIAKLTKLYKSEGLDVPTRSFDDIESFVLEQSQKPLFSQPNYSGAIRMTGANTFAGYSFLWPKNEQDVDLLNTYFTKDTNYGSHYTNADIYYHHSMDVKIGDEVVGKTVRAQKDDIGLWVEGQIEKSNQFWSGIEKLIKEGRLYWSGGTAGHLIRYADDGKGLRSFPIVEWSLTPTPAQPRLHSVSYLRSIGISVDETDGLTDGTVSPAETRRSVADDSQKRDSQKREVDNGNATDNSKTNSNFLENIMDNEKQLAEAIAAGVRAALDEKEKAQADAVAKVEADKKAEEVRAASEKAMIEKITAEVRASLPVQQDNRPYFPNGMQANINKTTPLGDFSYLKAVRGIVLSHYGKTNAWSGAEKERDVMTKYADEMRSALSENVGSLGAYLVPPQYVQEQFIPLLRSRAVVRAANPVVMQVNSNVAYIPSQTGGATAYWVGENSTLTASNLTVGQVAVTIKKLAGLEYVSNELLADSNPSVDQIMRQDLAAVLSLAEDTAYLTSDGTANAPVGMAYLPGITNLTCASDSGNGGAIQAADIFTMKRKMMQNNIPNDRWAWFCSPRTWDEIAQLKDSQNRYLLESLTGGNISQYPAYGTYPEGPETNYLGSVVGRLLGWPVFVTNNISETQTQGSTNTCSSLYLVRMADAVIAERAGLELMATNVAGTSFASDQTWIRAIMRVGFTVRHAPAVEIMKGLT